MRLFRYRIVKRSRPWTGTFFVIQKRFFLLPFWMDLFIHEMLTFQWNYFGNLEAAQRELRWQESGLKDEVVE